MIHLERTRDPRKLGGLTGSKLEEKLGKLLGYYYEEGRSKVNFKPKTRQIWGNAKAQLKAESSGKCAYCEADTAVVAHGDVEHFRPKDTYWWLAYCYDNYTFSCQICNQSHKSNKFPIVGPKLAPLKLPAKLPTSQQQLAKLVAKLSPDPAAVTSKVVAKLFAVEDADLPDPYLTDPEKLLTWREIADTKEVWVVARGDSPRAKRAYKAVDEVLGLNRTELLRLRWNHYEELETLALLLQEGEFSATKKRELLRKLQSHAGADRPFAAMKRHYLSAWGLLA